jgi:hypothetical protein
MMISAAPGWSGASISIPYLAAPRTACVWIDHDLDDARIIKGPADRFTQGVAEFARTRQRCDALACATSPPSRADSA